MRLTFSLEGEAKVISEFEGYKKRASNLTVPFRRVGEYMLETIDDNFTGRGSVWERWHRRRVEPVPYHPLLEDTGEMRGSFYSKSISDGVRIGNADSKFKYHQSRRPRSTMLPRRIMMDIAEPQRREIVRIVQRHIMEAKS